VLIKDASKILQHFQSSNGIFVFLKSNKRKKLFSFLLEHFSCNLSKLNERIGVSQHTVLNWYLGYTGIPIKKLLKLYGILGWKFDVNDVRKIKTIHNSKFYEVNLTSSTSPYGSTSLNA
jgi:hypothetical protein